MRKDTTPSLLEAWSLSNGSGAEKAAADRTAKLGRNLTGEMLLLPGANVYTAQMDRVVHKARNFAAAAQWDIEQQLQMTPQERQLIARRLRERVYGRKIKDVRACHATK